MRGPYSKLLTPVEEDDASNGATPSLPDRVEVFGWVKQVGWECHGEPLFQLGKWGRRRGEDIKERTCNRCSGYSVADGVRDPDENLVFSGLPLMSEDEEPREEVVVLCGLVALEHPYVRLDFLTGLGEEKVDLVRVVVEYAVVRDDELDGVDTP